MSCNGAGGGGWYKTAEESMANAIPVGGTIQPAPESMTLDQKFRLVEIAHETTDSAVKAAALDLLNNALHPPFIVSDE